MIPTLNKLSKDINKYNKWKNIPNHCQIKLDKFPSIPLINSLKYLGINIFL